VRCMPWIDPPGQDRGVIVRVEDNGPGIAPGDRERIFDVFFTTRAGGTGMGLAIARSVIEAHGGRLTVEPRRPVGTAFVIHLPLAGDAGGESAHQSGTSLTRHLPTSSGV
jgi:signal transduction histidine kinase